MKIDHRGKKAIIDLYLQGNNSQAYIAWAVGWSRRTVGRVLREAGLTRPMNIVTDTELQMVGQLRKYSVDLRTLRVLLRLAYPKIGKK